MSDPDRAIDAVPLRRAPKDAQSRRNRVPQAAESLSAVSSDAALTAMPDADAAKLRFLTIASGVTGAALVTFCARSPALEMLDIDGAACPNTYGRHLVAVAAACPYLYNASVPGFGERLTLAHVRAMLPLLPCLQWINVAGSLAAADPDQVRRLVEGRVEGARCGTGEEDTDGSAEEEEDAEESGTDDGSDPGLDDMD